MTVKQAEEQVGKFAREVVLKRAAVSTAVAFGLNFAVSKGWVAPNVSGQAHEWVNRAFDYASFIAGAWYIRKGVTPADPALNPTLADGSAAVAAHSADVPATVVVQHIYNNVPAAPVEEEPTEEVAAAEEPDPSLADAVAAEEVPAVAPAPAPAEPVFATEPLPQQ